MEANPWTRTLGIAAVVLLIASLLPYLIGFTASSYSDARDTAIGFGNLLVMSGVGFLVLWVVVNALTWKPGAEEGAPPRQIS